MGVITYLDSTLYKLYGDIVFIAILAFLGRKPVIPYATTWHIQSHFGPTIV